jgi:hypothetical protein
MDLLDDHTPEPPLPPVAPPAPTPAPRASLIPGRIPLWRLYVAAALSFGTYLAYWVWRTAREYGVGDRRRSTPIAWALGSFIPPVGAAVLYDFDRRARRRSGQSGAAGGASLLLLVLLALLSIPSFNYLFALALLVPLPFLLVQHSINRAAEARADVAHPPRRLVVPLVLAVVFGLPLTVATTYFLEWPALQQGLAPRLLGGSQVAGDSGLYELTLPSAEWRRVPSGTTSGDPTDMELVGPGVNTWVVIYSEPADDYDLEGAVMSRRTLILEEGQKHVYEETRRFLEGSPEFVPASLASYRVNYGPAGAGLYVVLTAEFESHVVEAVGFTGQPSHYGEELHQLLGSLRGTGAGGSS